MGTEPRTDKLSQSEMDESGNSRETWWTLFVQLRFFVYQTAAASNVASDMKCPSVLRGKFYSSLYLLTTYFVYEIETLKKKEQSCWKSWVHPAWYVIWGDLEKRRKCIVAHLRQTWRSRSTSAGDRLYRLPLTIFKDTNRRTGPLENLLEVLLRFSKDLHVYLVL